MLSLASAHRGQVRLEPDWDNRVGLYDIILVQNKMRFERRCSISSNSKLGWQCTCFVYIYQWFRCRWCWNDIVVTHMNNSLTMLIMSLHSIKRRTNVPRKQGYVENIIPQFLDEDFTTHYRVGRDVFNEILERITPDLTRTFGGSVDQTTPTKQLLVFLCYLANQESMREAGHYFGLAKWNVHVILRRVSATINNVLWHVSIKREFFFRTTRPLSFFFFEVKTKMCWA